MVWILDQSQRLALDATHVLSMTRAVVQRGMHGLFKLHPTKRCSKIEMTLNGLFLITVSQTTCGIDLVPQLQNRPHSVVLLPVTCSVTEFHFEVDGSLTCFAQKMIDAGKATEQLLSEFVGTFMLVGNSLSLFGLGLECRMKFLWGAGCRVKFRVFGNLPFWP